MNPIHWLDTIGGTGKWGCEARLVGYRRTIHPTEISNQRRKGEIGVIGTDILANNLRSMEGRLEASTDETKRKKLRERIEKGKAYLSKIEKEIESEEDMNEAREEWDNALRLGMDVRTEKKRYGEIIGVADSGIGELMDDQTEARMALAFQEADTSLSVRRVLVKPGKDQEVESAKREYIHKIPGQVVEQLVDLSNEVLTIIQGKLAESVEKKLKSFENAVDRFLKENKDSKVDSTVAEYRHRMEKVKSEINLKVRRFDPFETNGDEGWSDVWSNARRLEESIGSATRHVDEKGRRLKELRENREAKVGWIQKMSEYVITWQQRMSRPEIMKEALEAAKLDKVGNSKDPEVRSLQTATVELWAYLNGLAQGETPDPKEVEKIADRYESRQGVESPKVRETLRNVAERWKTAQGKQGVATQAPATLEEIRSRSDEELVEMESEVGGIYRKIENPQRADSARQAMVAIESADNVKMALEKVRDEVGGEKVELVSSAEFDEYKEYTKTGYMVFYERGDEWKIIVNRDELEKRGEGDAGEALGELKKQLRHELRHMEFEASEEVRGAWKTAFLSKRFEGKWNEVAEAYVASHADKRPPDSVEAKKTYTVSDWDPMDILSELYAMEGDLDSMGEMRDWVQRSERRARALLDPEALMGFPDFGSEEWIGKRHLVEKEFMEMGIDATGWSDRELALELVALSASEIMGSEALAEAAVVGPKAKIRGFEGGGGKKDKDEPKEKATNENVREQVGSIKKSIEKHRKSPFLGYVDGLKKVIDELEKENLKLEKKVGEMDPERLKKEVDKVQKLVDGDWGSVKKALMDASEKGAKVGEDPLRRFWRATYVYSWNDFKAVYEYAKEYAEKYFKREAGIHKGMLSKIVFEDVVEGLALGSSSFISGAWKDWNSAWEDKLKSKDVPQLYKYLNEQAKAAFPDKGVILSVVNILSEQKGAMDWTNKDLWKCLNKLQDETYLDENDEMLYKDVNYLREKLKIAFGAGPAYNKKAAFGERERKNEAAYESRKKDIEPIIKRAPSQIEPRLYQLLVKKKGINKNEEAEEEFFDNEKDDKNVDNAEYEEMIDYAIENGTISPESIFFYLMAGMACGFLKTNTGIRLTKWMNNFPPMDWFNGMGPKFKTKEDVHELVVNRFGEDYFKCKPGKKFREFYWTEVLMHGRVQSRMDKQSKPGGDGWDHDLVQGFVAAAVPRAIRKILKGPSSTATTEPTRAANLYVGAYNIFDIGNNAAKPLNRQQLERALASYFMLESILGGAAFNKDKSYIRKDAIGENEPPRASGESRLGEVPLSQYSKKLNGMMGSIPVLGGFFKIAVNKALAEAPSEEHFKKCMEYLTKNLSAAGMAWVRENISNSDDMFGNIETIVRLLLENVKEDKIRGAIRSSL